MIYNGIIDGKYIILKSVSCDDASFIIKIRSDENKTKFLHKIDANIDSQKKWIMDQINRNGDFYFIFSDKNGNNKGLASVYNIDEENKNAEFGRWISVGNVFENLESVILLFDFAFKNFNIDYIYLRMVQGNDYVSNFWKTFGAQHVGLVDEMDLNIDKWIVTKNDYYSRIRDKNIKLLRY